VKQAKFFYVITDTIVPDDTLCHLMDIFVCFD